MRKQISLHVVTAGVAVSAAFAGIHRNHHFDTIQRLHPLLHPPKTHPVSAVSSIKKEISRQGNISFFLIINDLSSIPQIKYELSNAFLFQIL